MTQEEILKELINDPGNKPDLLKLYEIYFKSSETISERRTKVNNFFLTAFGILIGITGILFENKKEILLIVPIIIGIIFGISWLFQISYYKSLNRAKFSVINEIEKYLPAKGFTIEWELFEQNEKKIFILPVSVFEIILPVIMIIIFALFFVIWLIPFVN